MNSRIKLLAAAAFWIGCTLGASAQQNEAGAPAQIEATINTQQTAEPVSKYEFGMFIEHIGPLIYRSLWSEMLDDRKFYFPITSKEPEPPAGSNAARARRNMLRRWVPVGPDEVVTMDKEQPFVGDQSPRIALDSSTPHGIQQTGIALVNGKKYVGRIYLRGTPGSRVKVSLIWGDGAHNRQTVTFSSLTESYKKFPFNFTAGADTAQGAFEIAGTGSGDFHVGTVSLMPGDNIDGFRPDTTALLRQLHSGMWRLPGGNFLSDWSWYNGVGDVDKRPPTFDHAWNAMQPNDVGLDEFMTLCKLIDVEPYITVNAGLGDAHSAAQEVEYMNGSVDTPMGAWRAKNGHPEPYHVKFWNIGNEPWGTFQIGYTDLKYYVIKHNEFAKAMRKADPSITIIASAKMLEPMALTGENRSKYVDNMQPVYGTDIDWTGGILKNCWGTFDGIAEHWYEYPGRHFDIEKAKSLPPDAPSNGAWVKYTPTTLQFARYAGDVIRRKAEEWEGYQQRFPEMLKKKTFLSIDEYAYFGASGFGRGVTLQSALAYAMLFNEEMRHTDFLTMTAHTMGTSTLDITPTASTMNTTGLVFKLYGDHFVGSIPVDVAGNSPQPPTHNPPYADQPKTRSGSPTYPLDVFAALTPDRKYLNVAVVNVTDSEQKLHLNFGGATVQGASTLWQITGKDLNAEDRVGQPAQVAIKEIPIGGALSTITVAPISIDVYRFPLEATNN
ncbi:MAG TPA: alpha-N-arabinofuranosidase [Terracidiphilus sp.]|nr:alpha-N-arabinofuranosidase [Terracidiphilus sp.]